MGRGTMDQAVRLRALQENDAEALYNLYRASDAHLFTTPFWHPWSLHSFRQFVNEALANTNVLRLGICKVKANGEELIGFIELNHLNWVHGTAEVGITIFPVDDRCKGLGTCAVRSVALCAFNTLRLRRLHAKMYANNDTSRRCFEKVGFKHEGTLRR